MRGYEFAAGVCFGNLTLAIREAAESLTHAARAIELIFTWLAEGYDPGIADTKIEEWTVIIEAMEAA